MPMPRISEVSAVRQSEKKIEFSPTDTITRTKLVAAPVKRQRADDGADQRAGDAHRQRMARRRRQGC